MKKVDIHAHVLPGADDGAETIRESHEMLRMDVRQGFRTVIATPHYSAQYRNDRPEWIRSQCRKLESWAREKLNPELRIFPGQEIFYSEDVPEKLERGELLTLGGSSYVLVEFHPAAAYSAIYRAVRELTAGRYTPVLAHIERYEALRETGRIEELLRAGARMQMNYRSVQGAWYRANTRWCRRMLKEGRIHFLSTDMHNTSYRSPDTEETCQWMEAHLPKGYIRELCCKNAEKILNDERVGSNG